jgi:hypothetical protein
MGKRELLIAIAFIAVGATVYQFTAPPEKPGQGGFSFSRMWNDARRGMRRNAAQATVTETVTIPLRLDQVEVRVSGVNRGVRVMGEVRTDIAYELTASSNGQDQAAAMALAKQVLLKQDALGSSVALRAVFPRDGSQTASVVLRVPSRLAVRIGSGNGVYAGKVASVDLDNVSGDVTVLDIPGALTGQHRNGELRVTDIGTVKLTLSRSQATFERVRHGLTIDARNGELHISGSSGPIQLDAQNTDSTVNDHAGPVHIAGSGGRAIVTSPHEETQVDMRGTEVEVTLAKAVPMSLLTNDDTLRLLLDGSPALTVDAIASEGEIQAGDFQLHGEPGDREVKLWHTFGANGPRVTLRNSHGDIVIRKAK